MEGRLIRLAPLRDQDAEPLFEWINDRELVILNAPFEPVSRADHDRWFDRIRSAPDVEIFGIRRIGDDELIGSCQLNGIDRESGRATLQIRIGERDAWGQGYGTDAVRILVSHAFEALGLDRVELDVFAHNRRAIRAYEKAGFSERGVREDAGVVEGVPVDVIEMAIEAADRR